MHPDLINKVAETYQQHGKSVALMRFLGRVTRRLGVSQHAYVVGGAVRNHILKEPIKDIDLVLDSIAAGRDSKWLAQEIATSIPTATDVTTNQYEVAILTIKGEWELDGFPMQGEVIEIANAREESYSKSEHLKAQNYKPSEVRPATIEQDVYRREFTFNCMTGDTLVPTSDGLLRIDMVAKATEGSRQAINLTVAGRTEPTLAVGWQYSGRTRTLRVTTDQGNSFSCTAHHPILVLRGNDLKWVQADQLSVGDLLCWNPRQVTRSYTLPISLSEPTKPKRGKLKEVSRPTHMTPDLAFVIGCLVSEGSVGGNRVNFSNGDLKLIASYEQRFEIVFGFKPSRNRTAVKGKISEGRCVPRRDCFDIYADSQTVVKWLGELGLYCGGPKDGKSASHHKVVPWSILQADMECQAAFLAAYLEGDGSVYSTGRMVYLSASPHIRNQLQILLGAHGVMSRVEDRFVYLTARDSAVLWPKVRPYMVSKGADYTRPFKSRNSYGVPKAPTFNFLKSRLLHYGHHGTTFRTDDGGEVTFSQWDRCVPAVVHMLLYDAYDTGLYQAFMGCLARISPSEHEKLERLFEAKYKFVAVQSITENGEQDVYDLSMTEGAEPAFVANNIVVHNTLLWRLHDLAEGPDKAEIIDITGRGLRDLRDRVIRTPLDPDKTFGDDPTRMLRVLKFSTKYSLRVPPEIRASIRRTAPQLKGMPHNAVSKLLLDYILPAGVAHKAIPEMEDLGLLDVIKEMVQEVRPFRETLMNWVHAQPVQYMFRVMDMGLPLVTKMQFLTDRQRARLKELVVGMTAEEGDDFLATLRQPGRVLDTEALIEEFRIPPQDRRDLLEAARAALLDQPGLRHRPAELTSLVRGRYVSP